LRVAICGIKRIPRYRQAASGRPLRQRGGFTPAGWCCQRNHAPSRDNLLKFGQHTRALDQRSGRGGNDQLLLEAQRHNRSIEQ
jgi:hypothetical protein